MRPLLLFFSWEKMGEGKGKEKLTHLSLRCKSTI